MLLLPLSPHLHQFQRPQTAAGVVDFLLSDVVLVSSSLTELTACQKSSARVLAISKPDVHSDEPRNLINSSKYKKHTSLLAKPPLSTRHAQREQ
jgi:hypothetical protein